MTLVTAVSPALSVWNMTKTYSDVVAVDGLTMTVTHGEVVGLVGPNGCGKSTTLAAVAGVRRIDEGRILVEGHPAGTIDARRKLAFVPDVPSGFDELTVTEFVALYRAIYRQGSDFSERAERLLGAFGLAPRADTPLGALSNGMRRISAIVAAVAHRPRVLVIDEATAALDPEAVILLRDAIRKRRACGLCCPGRDAGPALRRTRLSPGGVAQSRPCGRRGDCRRRPGDVRGAHARGRVRAGAQQ